MQPHHIDHVLLSNDQINSRIDELSEEIAADLAGSSFVVVGVLRGSFVFLADLVRALHHRGLRMQMDFLTLESYGSGTESSGNVRVSKDLWTSVQGREVLLVDDILDTGRTLDFATKYLMLKGASAVHKCVCLNKPSRRAVEIEARYIGFEVEDRFVVGYGLDYDGHYRELPHIAEVTFIE